jgi:hypothetical protein
MTTIVDPDFLTDSAVNKTAAGGPTVFINTANRTIRLNNGQNGTDANASGTLLDEDGVTLQCLYSFLKQQWKDDPRSKSLIAYPFPLTAITPEQFEFNFGWKLADDSSRDLIRTGGWREIAEDNATINREYLGVISLGNIDGDQNQDGGGDQDTVYYAFFDSATNAPRSSAIDFSFPGEVNQAINTYINGGTDYRSDILRLFIRQEGKSYDQTDTRDIGITAGTTLPYNVQRFPLVEGTDLDVTVSDATIIANSNAEGVGGSSGKYDSADNAGPTLRYLSSAVTSDTLGYTKDLQGAGSYPFGVLINAQSGETGGANLSKNELYSWVQYSLRRDVNIEDSAGASKIGKLQDELLQFVGPTLKTKNVTNLDGGGTGVAITNFLSTDVNTLEFQDNNLAPQTFPFTANGTISFSDTIREDLGDAKFWVYYDYTRRYGGGTTDITISDRGPAAGDATLDSANITLSAGFTGTTAALAANPVATGGINPAQEGDNYIKLAGMVNAANNGVILKVIDTSGNNFLRVNTLDDVDLVDEANTVGAFLETHPLNSPGSLLVDSAGTTVENSGGITSTLAANNLTDGAFSFTYDYDGNTQKDRVNQNSIGVDPAIVIRALGLEKGSWVQLTNQVIDRIDNNPYSVVSALERNYSDPE